MRLLDLTLPTVAENLALDEALLEEAEAGSHPQETLRLWESPQKAVILGRASKIAGEIDLEACRSDDIVIARRSSGGCAVMIGPGCLMYSVVLSYERRPQLQVIDHAHQFVLERLRRTLGTLLDNVEFHGTCDLTHHDRKFSGNSLRCKRTHLLYHGTVLYDFPLVVLGKYLRKPPREPEYRAGRSHRDFVSNIAIDPAALKRKLAVTFECEENYEQWPRQLVSQLVATRYSREEWHHDR